MVRKNYKKTTRGLPKVLEQICMLFGVPLISVCTFYIITEYIFGLLVGGAVLLLVILIKNKRKK